MKKTICHKDGTVTIWSVYEQCWKNKVLHVPARELAAMAAAERSRVMKHLKIK